MLKISYFLLIKLGRKWGQQGHLESGKYYLSTYDASSDDFILPSSW